MNLITRPRAIGLSAAALAALLFGGGAVAAAHAAGEPGAPILSATLTPALPTGATWYAESPVEVALSAIPDGPGRIASLSWTLSGATTGSGSVATGAATVPVSADGITTIDFGAASSDEQVSQSSVTVRIDTVEPRLVIDSPDLEATYHVGDTVTLSYHCEDEHSGVASCALFPHGTINPSVPSGTPVTFDSASPVWYVDTTDVVGNRAGGGAMPQILPHVIPPDGTAPTISAELTIPASASGWVTDRDTKLHVEAADDELDRIEYARFNGASGWGPWTTLTNEGSWDLPITTEGESGYRVRAFDASGNESATVERVIRADFSTNAATISGFPSTFDQGEEYPLVFTCSDGVSGVADCTSSIGPSGTLLPTDELGAHSFTLTSTDVAGNSVTTTWPYTVVAVDTTPPVLTISTSEEPTADGWYSGEIVSVAIEGDDDTHRIRLSAVGADPQDEVWYSSARGVYTAVRAEGVTTFTAVAEDAAGNQSDPVTFVVRLDRTLPTLEVTSPEVAPGLVAATVEFEQGEVVDLGLDCADELSGVAECGGEGAEAGLLPTAQPGEHELTVFAVDRAGNRTEDVLRYTVLAAPADPEPGSGAPGRALAGTGSEILPALLGVIALALSGAILLVTRRRLHRR